MWCKFYGSEFPEFLLNNTYNVFAFPYISLLLMMLNSIPFSGRILVRPYGTSNILRVERFFGQ